MAHARGKELRLPYCAPHLLSDVTALPLKVRLGPRRKEILRCIAERLGLPPILVDRPKKAAQYGSGVMKGLKAVSRRERTTVEDYLRRLSPKG